MCLPTATHTSLYRQAVNIYAYIKIKDKINLKKKLKCLQKNEKRQWFCLFRGFLAGFCFPISAPSSNLLVLSAYG